MTPIILFVQAGEEPAAQAHRAAVGVPERHEERRRNVAVRGREGEREAAHAAGLLDERVRQGLGTLQIFNLNCEI